MTTADPSRTPSGDSEYPHRYNAALANHIEPQWQAKWDAERTFAIANPGSTDFDAGKPKFFCMDMFPYPSGAGLHVGHPEGYTATDIICRFKRHQGFNVLHPMGWDAFGLPAEQYAIQTGVHPAITTRKAIDTFRRQLKRFGFSYDWSREFATIDPDYYKWTQWIFLRIYDSWYDVEHGKARPIIELVSAFESGAKEPSINPNAAEFSIEQKARKFGAWTSLSTQDQRTIIDSHRLAYIAQQTVNWCPKLGTALANEEVIDGRSERGDFPVFRKPLRQWMFRITAYADRLLNDLALVKWPESTRTQQAEWIGRSEGAEIDFRVEPLSERLPVSRLSEPRVAALLDQTPGHPQLNPVNFVGRNPFPPREPSPSDLTGFIRNMPHLELPEATYFVTWRVRPGITLSESERDLALRALLHWDGQRCQVYAANVMPDHIHWIVRPFDGHSLGSLVESVKKFSSREINQRRGVSGHLWLDERFDHIIRDTRWFSEFLFYVVRNPVEAELVESPSQYPWTAVHGDVVTEDGETLGWNMRTHGSESRGTSHRSESGATSGATSDATLRVFTTRPDTIFGATFMVVAPEHPLIAQVLANPAAETDAAKLRAYVEAARNKSDVDRQADTKDKTGVFTGAYAINPATNAKIPIWTADYVLMGYGHGAIMAVPGHDERDFEFARKFNLPITQVVGQTGLSPSAELEQAFCGEGVSINSANADVALNGLSTADAKKTIIAWLERTGRGSRRINYKLRDWLFSRQRYWGEPFPIVFDAEGNHYPIGEKALPLTLPDMADYQPIESDDPQPLLAKAGAWINTTAGEAGVDPRLLPSNAPVRREANTMPGWAGSCWYYLRYCDPKNAQRFVSRDAEKYWMVSAKVDGSPHAGGVDLYIGGNEHAVLHLLYARFWHKVLFDLGEVSTPEPFGRLFHQGMITSWAFKDSTGRTVPIDEVEERDGRHFLKANGEQVEQIVAKMSKTLKNVVNPDDVIAEFGADTFRLYEMYMGPLDAGKPWNPRDIAGCFRFLQRVWRLVIDEQSGALKFAAMRNDEIEKQLHRMIVKVAGDIERLAMNTAIATMIEFTNAATSGGGLTREQLERFAVVLSPFAPHMAEELWSRLGFGPTIAYAKWPSVDESMLRDDAIEMPVQISGKTRGKITVPADADAKAIEELALKDEKVAQMIEGKTVRKVIVVPGKIINIVAN